MRKASLSKNGDAILTGLPELILTDKTGQKEYGTLYALSLPEVAGLLGSYREEAFHPMIILAGYFAKALHWQREDVGNDDEMYNDTIIMEVEMKKDWNLLKYEIA